ncbi:MAG: DUF4082 domain-containing protein [Acidobacteria bacterium]|nr:DUF4082 domain-containing protein [Acidobacteriota bacterium]
MKQPSSRRVLLRLWQWSLFSIMFSLFVIVPTASAAYAQDAAPFGSPYRWSQNSTPTSNANRSSAPGLNVIGNTTDIALDPNGGDLPGAYEAGGILWSNSQQLKSVTLINGSRDGSSMNGVFCSNLTLQTTTDGSTWVVSNWSVSQSYSYDSSGASLQTYTFSGSDPITVLGVRISGQVHCSDSGSWVENMREIVAVAPNAQTIWAPSTTPATLDVNDYTGAVNLGVRFQSSEPGTISGIRFYKAPQNTGTHTATLYSDTGAVLAQVNFSNETGSGWQEVDFPPVSIPAKTTYVAAYHTTNGHYSVSGNFFTSDVSNGQQLTARANGAGGEANGVYGYGDGVAFPTQTYNANNYWVDVVFNVAGGVPPASAGNLQGDHLSSERAQLTWTASPGDPTGVAYSVYRNGVFAGTTGSTVFTDIGLSPNTSYAYYVVAFNGYGSAAKTDTIEVTTPDNYMPVSLRDFFPVGPDAQPASLLQTWKDRGANTLARTPVGISPADFAVWNSTADSLGFQYIRDADPNGPVNDASAQHLLAWHQPDEPESSTPVVSASKIVSQYKAWKQIDSGRAVSLNFNGGWLIGQQAGCDLTCYASYIQGADWVMSDIYPLSGWGQPGSLGWIGQSVDTLYSLAPDKPIMQFVETAYQGLSWCESCPAPTPEQFRAEFWEAIIHGARGVFVFPERIGPFSFDNTTPEMDAEITKQFNTATSLGSVLQGVINPIGMSASVSSPLEVAWRNYNGHQYIFVLNFSYNEKDGQTITLTGIGSATQAVVYGESRSVPITNGAITDNFGKHEIHIYQIN